MRRSRAKQKCSYPKNTKDCFGETSNSTKLCTRAPVGAHNSATDEHQRDTRNPDLSCVAPHRDQDAHTRIKETTDCRNVKLEKKTAPEPRSESIITPSKYSKLQYVNASPDSRTKNLTPEKKAPDSQKRQNRRKTAPAPSFVPAITPAK